MLRRRLLVIFGSLVILLAAVASTGIWRLQGILAGLDHLNEEALFLVEQVNRLNTVITSTQLDLYRLQTGRQRHLDTLIDDVEAARGVMDLIGDHYVVRGRTAKSAYASLTTTFSLFERYVGLLATAQDARLSREYQVEALTAAMAMRADVARIDREVSSHAQQEQYALTARFRWLILGGTIACVLVVSISIIVLLRAAGMVLKPVGRLVEATRQLTRERFDHRTHFDRDDEFLELAEGYNVLAEWLQTSEKRKMETLSQMALTLNHELNNAMTTVEMQLQLLQRCGSQSGQFKSVLQGIRQALKQMAKTVESLKHIRRIVLTDYVAGVKMVDLQRSVQDDAASPLETGRSTEEVSRP